MAHPLTTAQQRAAIDHKTITTMNTTLIIYLYILLALLVALAYGIAALHALWEQHRAKQRERLATTYTQQILQAQIDDNSDRSGITAKTYAQRLALAEAIHRIISHTYSTPTDVIRHLTAKYDLENLLLDRLRRASNTRKAQLLDIMSSIPLSRRAIDAIAPLLGSHDRHLRIAALIATLAASPAKAIRIVAELPNELKPYDTSRIIALLRRGLLPIAYEPLLMSDNHNLLRLGIAITHNFGIEIADKHLHNIILRKSDPQITREAIYALATLGRPLGRQHIRARLSAMQPTLRRELCHHLSCEGYSLTTLRGLFAESDICHAEPLINSYKRDLICQQSN